MTSLLHSCTQYFHPMYCRSCGYEYLGQTYRPRVFQIISTPFVLLPSKKLTFYGPEFFVRLHGNKKKYSEKILKETTLT